MFTFIIQQVKENGVQKCLGALLSAWIDRCMWVQLCVPLWGPFPESSPAVRVVVLIFAAVVVVKGEQQARHRRKAHNGLTLRV